MSRTSIKRVLAILMLWAATMGPLTTMAQQNYNDTEGYACNAAPSSTSCSTFAFYRTFQAGESLRKVGDYFNKTAAAVANVSGMNLLSTTASLKQTQALYVPLDCRCLNARSQMQVSHTIVKGDTFWLLSVTEYGGLTRYQAMMASNPSKDVYNLTIGDTITVPIFCACPTAAQVANGTNYLVTTTVYPSETLDIISARFGISTTDLSRANNVNSSSILDVNTTLLVPLATLPPLATMDWAPVTSQPPPSPPATVASPNAAPAVITKSASQTPLYIGIAVGAFGLTLAAVFALLLLFKASRNSGTKPKDLYESHEYYHPAPTGSTRSTEEMKRPNMVHLELLAGMSDMVGSEKPVLLSHEEIQSATQGFSPENFIQGSVYKGCINGQLVAIKQMKGNMTQELKILCQVHHSNLVKLVGLCVGGSENLYLVYEYAKHGSLNDCLRNQAAIGRTTFSQSAAYLPWCSRVRIALDVASGLEYIHNYTNPSFVHKDVKTSNILLDENFRAKVANFGMAKSAASADAGPLLTRHITGTQGYMAPEYLEHGLVTVKADVYAFGVVVLEILSGKEAVVRPEKDEEEQGVKERALSDIIVDVLNAGTAELQTEQLRKFIDPQLHSAYPIEIASSIASLAMTCIDPDPAVRPSMKDVTFALSKMLAASLEWESTAEYGSGMSTVPIEAR